MITAEKWQCAQCGYSSDAAVCAMCGALPPGAETPPPPQEGARDSLAIDWGEAEPTVEAQVWGMPAKPFFFLVGALVAPLFAVGSFMPRFGWFLGALFHESGHTVTALAFGMPAFPAITRKDGGASRTVSASASKLPALSLTPTMRSCAASSASVAGTIVTPVFWGTL